MDVLTDIVRNLLVIIILSSFLELLLPEGQLKPFVRFAIGLFVIVAVLSPTLSYLYDNRDFEVESWNYEVDSQKGAEILKKGQTIQEDLGKKNSSLIKEKVQGQINAVAMLVPGVDGVQTDVQVGADGNVNEIKLMVSTQDSLVKSVDQVNVFSGMDAGKEKADHEQIQSKIRQVLKNLYGIDEKQINIQFEGGKKNAG